MSHPNETVLRSMYKALDTGDMRAFLDVLDDDVVWHTPAGTPMAGTYRGKGAVAELFARVRERTGNSFRIEVHDVLANDEHAVGLVRARGEREGKTLDEPVAHIVHVVDGRITEFWPCPQDGVRFAEFFA